MQTTVSSRELDRKTGEVKKAALNGPVFITEQGRPSHVLITVEAYRALSLGAEGVAPGKNASVPA